MNRSLSEAKLLAIAESDEVWENCDIETAAGGKENSEELDNGLSKILRMMGM